MLQYCILLTFIFTRITIVFNLSEEIDDKLVLKPAELVDLILQERSATGPQDASVVSLLNLEDLDSNQVAESEPEESTDDGEALRSRKVWSRWSKWGACSVSCGEGVMTRRRACVAGRCARGEREEQRRLCHRALCRDHDNHDSD